MPEDIKHPMGNTAYCKTCGQKLTGEGKELDREMKKHLRENPGHTAFSRNEPK